MADNNDIGWAELLDETDEKIADLTAERDALKEALGDSQATLCAVRATSVSDDWAEPSTAKHLHDICGETMQRNAAALKGGPASDRETIIRVCAAVALLRRNVFGGEPTTENEKNIVDHIHAAILALIEQAGSE